jgi:hypothetical protein
VADRAEWRAADEAGRPVAGREELELGWEVRDKAARDKAARDKAARGWAVPGWAAPGERAREWGAQVKAVLEWAARDEPVPARAA